MDRYAAEHTELSAVQLKAAQYEIIAEKLNNIKEINILPYHSLGEEKLKQLGKTISWESPSFTDENTIAEWIKLVQSKTEVSVSIG